jgi:hypothetical protein
MLFEAIFDKRFQAQVKAQRESKDPWRSPNCLNTSLDRFVVLVINCQDLTSRLLFSKEELIFCLDLENVNIYKAIEHQNYLCIKLVVENERVQKSICDSIVQMA